MVGDTNFKQETPRFFEGAKQGLDDQKKAHDTRLRQETPRFFEGAKQGLGILEKASVVVDRHLARRFSTFRYIHLDENCMSDVLADLLRPDSAHGQGDLFLAALLKHLRSDKATQLGMKQILPDDSTWSHSRVYREAPTTHIDNRKRRIDIEIRMSVDGRLVGIAIENKPGKRHPLRQLDDYAENLKKKYKGQYLLLYLTPHGKSPPPESLPPERQTELGDHFACVSLVDWARGWMQEAENQVKASYVQKFVGDFRQVLLQDYADAETAPYLTMLP